MFAQGFFLCFPALSRIHYQDTGLAKLCCRWQHLAHHAAKVKVGLGGGLGSLQDLLNFDFLFGLLSFALTQNKMCYKSFLDKCLPKKTPS